MSIFNLEKKDAVTFREAVLSKPVRNWKKLKVLNQKSAVAESFVWLFGTQINLYLRFNALNCKDFVKPMEADRVLRALHLDDKVDHKSVRNQILGPRQYYLGASSSSALNKLLILFTLYIKVPFRFLCIYLMQKSYLGVLGENPV